MTSRRITTQRLTLTPHELTDFDDSYSLFANEEVTRYITGRPGTREEAWSRLLRYIGHWHSLGFGYWVIRERDTGAFVGEMGFARYERIIEPSFEGIPEIGWALLPAMQGKGYAHEALSAALAWADEAWPERTTGCIISPANEPSIRLASRHGYQHITSTTYAGEDTLVFHRVKD
ncbi:RimJ/RimL family protein N-acetyltransferase [Luteibacter sp. Sphag1AF]|uniref:GNAT family N-acetyltransferase n=1 Tax=Luteibacter sp. Sphag1AF TaxID=2587031 RepID=UPI0016215FE8|nr:RimJ/RimL family protein N-acetyltransferase [Luteibacter sp. Sphag1AF]